MSEPLQSCSLSRAPYIYFKSFLSHGAAVIVSHGPILWTVPWRWRRLFCPLWTCEDLLVQKKRGVCSPVIRSLYYSSAVFPPPNTWNMNETHMTWNHRGRGTHQCNLFCRWSLVTLHELILVIIFRRAFDFIVDRSKTPHCNALQSCLIHYHFLMNKCSFWGNTRRAFYNWYVSPQRCNYTSGSQWL